MAGSPSHPPTGIQPPLTVAQALARVTQARARAAILVEGWSDEAAIEAAALHGGAALAARGVVLLPVGGVTNLGKFAQALRAETPSLQLAGLYDASEESVALRGLQRAGLLAAPTREAAAGAGFHACESDLEDELIRAAGTDVVERLLAQEMALASFRRFQRQPEHRERALHAQLKRFMGTRAGRKARFGLLLAEALAPERLPAPLRAVLAQVDARDALSAATARTPAPRASRTGSPPLPAS